MERPSPPYLSVWNPPGDGFASPGEVMGIQSVIELKAGNNTLHGYVPDKPADLVFTAGALSQIDPMSLRRAYEALFFSSRRYILIAEYYSPQPQEISKGQFSRNFVGEMMEALPNSLRIVDRDPQHHWFLLEKLHNEDPRSFSPAF